MKYKVLEKYFGFSSFKPKQEEIIDQILLKRDTLSILHTGFGKSLIFQIPGLIFEGLTLVICPLISLMKDQVDDLKKRGIKAEYIASTRDSSDIKKIYQNINDLKFLYVSGERLKNKEFLSVCKNVSFLVIDEAHTLLWSKEFRSDLKYITKFILSFNKNILIAAFTATLLEHDLKFIKDFLLLKDPYITISAPKRDNLCYKVLRFNKDKNLFKLLDKHKDSKGIIYCLTINAVDRVYDLLKDKYTISKYHGKMDKNEKEYNQNNFSNLMVATNAFGMGIDIKDIRFVIIYELPINILDLLQQLGRAGRDGILSYAYILYDPFNLDKELNFIKKSNVKQNEMEFRNVLRFIYSFNKEKFIDKLFNFK